MEYLKKTCLQVKPYLESNYNFFPYYIRTDEFSGSPVIKLIGMMAVSNHRLIKREEFILETNIDDSTLTVIENLLTSEDKDNHIIARQIFLNELNKNKI